MKNTSLFIILLSAFLSLGSAGPIYNYMLITPPTGMAAIHYWQPEPLTMPEPLPPRRSVPERYKGLFAFTSSFYGIPPEILESIAFIESGFMASAQSPIRDDGHRDLGMFQFNDKYLDWYSRVYNEGILFDPFVPEEAIRVAALHIVFLYERYGTWMDVFFAYNAGMDRVDRDVIPDSAWDYLRKIYAEG